MHTSMEIERKYLIRMPDEELLRAMPGCELWEIEQTYLRGCGNGFSSRLRRIRSGDKLRCVRTEKRRVSDLSCEESEGEISQEEYARLLRDADPELSTIRKRRYRIPHGDLLLEIDIYSFWSDRATLEIELSCEEQEASLPDWLDVVRELTGDGAYKNLALAREVPMEKI